MANRPRSNTLANPQGEVIKQEAYGPIKVDEKAIWALSDEAFTRLLGTLTRLDRRALQAVRNKRKTK
jgi:hypothetical protein